MHRELLIAAGPGEWRAVLVENAEPVELRVERGEGGEIDGIYKGRVVALLPALGAALVDLGGERPAFLPQSEVFPRGHRPDEGAALVVQIRREAQGGKPARLTTAITLRGRHVELTIGRPGLAADVLDATDRARIAAAADTARFGLRMRQAAAVERLVAEAAILRRRWKDIAAEAARAVPPVRLFPQSGHAPALAAIFPAPDRIFVDTAAAVTEICAAFPDTEIALLPAADWPFDPDALIDAALAPTVAVAGGGTLHIAATRAASMIDVDSGTPATGSPPRTALAANLAAAAAIAREIRRRNLGGAIVVDFVGLDDRRARERVRAALAAALAPDPRQPQILGWTRLGHLELVRRRPTTPLAEQLLEERAPVKTAASVAYEALRALARAGRAEPGHAWRLTVAPEVAAALSGEIAGAVRAFEARQGRPLAIAADPALPRERFQIAPA